MKYRTVTYSSRTLAIAFFVAILGSSQGLYSANQGRSTSLTDAKEERALAGIPPLTREKTMAALGSLYDKVNPTYLGSGVAIGGGLIGLWIVARGVEYVITRTVIPFAVTGSFSFAANKVVTALRDELHTQWPRTFTKAPVIDEKNDTFTPHCKQGLQEGCVIACAYYLAKTIGKNSPPARISAALGIVVGLVVSAITTQELYLSETERQRAAQDIPVLTSNLTTVPAQLWGACQRFGSNFAKRHEQNLGKAIGLMIGTLAPLYAWPMIRGLK